MSEKDHIDDLQAKMKALRSEREKKPAAEASTGDVKDFMSNVHATITPIVKAFVKEDRSLMVQSSDERNIFIGYGYHQVCKISVFSPVDTVVQVHLGSETGTECIYNGTFDKEKLQSSVKDALLRWYLLIS